MTRIKICGLTRVDDALAAADAGADLLGFIFVPSSKRYVDAGRVAGIIASLRSAGHEIPCVGVFAERDAGRINDIASEACLDIVQCHGVRPSEDHDLALPAIQAHRVKGRIDWPALREQSSWAILLDAYDPHSLGGSGRTWDWEVLNSRPDCLRRLIVAGGLNPLNVGCLIRAARPWGVDVASGVESAPGIKDHAAVAAFVHAVRQEDTL